MSYGDEIMASGQARALAAESGRRVRVVDIRGGARWSDLWAGLVWMQQPGDARNGAIELRNGPGCRPYIDYAAGFSIEGGCHYTDWRARDHRGAIAFTPEEAAFAESAEVAQSVLIEPNISPRGNPNKQWGRWAEMVSLRPDIDWIQVGPAGTNVLPGVRHIETDTFRLGASVLAECHAAVLPEGGLHHAGAAVGHPPRRLLCGRPAGLACPAHSVTVRRV
jgi:hypothetical protein